ncbi:hypothetical protein AMTRI_Chr04g183940 [Amborella trichopoda]
MLSWKLEDGLCLSILLSYSNIILKADHQASQDRRGAGNQMELQNRSSRRLRIQAPREWMHNIDVYDNTWNTNILKKYDFSFSVFHFSFTMRHLVYIEMSLRITLTDPFVKT